jgi:hypothetical protein
VALKWLCYSAGLKLKTIYAAEHGNRATGCKFTISEPNPCCWQNGSAFIYPCKATIKSCAWPKKGRHPDVDASVLCSVKEMCAKGMPVTWHDEQVEATETAKSLGIGNFKAG